MFGLVPSARAVPLTATTVPRTAVAARIVAAMMRRMVFTPFSVIGAPVSLPVTDLVNIP